MKQFLGVVLLLIAAVLVCWAIGQALDEVRFFAS
jgi:hypothetical protein